MVQYLLLLVERKCSHRFQNRLFNRHVDLFPIITNLAGKFDSDGSKMPP